MDYPMGIILEKFADNGKKSSVICLNLPLSAKIAIFAADLRTKLADRWNTFQSVSLPKNTVSVNVQLVIIALRVK
jgi:hypothetical protein